MYPTRIEGSNALPPEAGSDPPHNGGIVRERPTKARPSKALRRRRGREWWRRQTSFCPQFRYDYSG